LTAAGLILAVRRRTFQALLVASWFFLPYVFYSFTTAGLTRIYTVLLPATALLSGSIFSSDPRALSMQRRHSCLKSILLNLIFVGLIVSNGIYFGYQQVVTKDGYAQAKDYLEAHGPAKVISTNVPIMEIYVGEDRVASRPPATQDELRQLYQEGFRFYVIDGNKWLYSLYQKDRVEIMESIASKVPRL
jgi:hypothetical protein